MLDWLTLALSFVSAWFFLVYFTTLFFLYFLINMVSGFVLLWQQMKQDRAFADSRRFMQLELEKIAREYAEEHENIIESKSLQYREILPPVSILVPAYNESATIVASVYSLLKLEYDTYEIIVVNDGSKDDTLHILLYEFEAVPVEDKPCQTLMSQAVRTVYRSSLLPNLRIIDKVNGGKADAVNVGINFSEYEYFCCIDADSILHPMSLKKLIRPFIDDSSTIACGGTVHVINGCEVRDGVITKVGLTSNWLALFQIVEYMRTLLFGRLSWASFNSLLIISGAFGMFRKDKVLEAGGYMHGTIGEDMELVVRLHRIMRQRKEKYRIAFVPEPLCWTEVPEDWQTLKNQRVRWQRGLCESIVANRELLFKIRGGATAWTALPFMLVFELLGPIIEVLGYIFIVLLIVFNIISPLFALILFIVPIFVGTLITVNAIVVQELLYQIYRNPRYILLMVGLAVLENFGYRQINMYWRIIGLWRWFRGRKSVWGEMRRTATWDKNKKHYPQQPFILYAETSLPEHTTHAPLFNPHTDFHFDPHFDSSRLAGKFFSS